MAYAVRAFSSSAGLALAGLAGYTRAMTRKPPPDKDAQDPDPLWRAVTETVRPLAGRPAPPPLPRRRPAPLLQPREMPQPAGRVSDRIRPEAASLDAGWDRRIRTGKLEADIIVDLHGHSLTHAHDVLAQAIRRAFAHHQRVVLVITGKGGNHAEGRGAIRSSLPIWLESPGLRGFIAALRPAHPRHGGAGAWYVVLRRQRGSAEAD